jgi:hypothetical protein
MLLGESALLQGKVIGRQRLASFPHGGAPPPHSSQPWGNLMRFLTGLAAASILSALSMSAFAGSMDARIGNTVVATNPDGSTVKFYYNADNTFTAKAEAGGKTLLESKGTWRQDGDNLCLTSDTTFGPFEAGKERCVPLMGEKVGDKWETPGKDAEGNDISIKVEIVAGS